MKFLKIGGVILGALIITTLGISAADTFSGNSGSLLGQLSKSEVDKACPEDMTQVAIGQTFSCVDTYEVSPAEACPNEMSVTIQDTQANLNEFECAPESKAGARPWTYVTRSQAQTLCARVGKRLPTSAEWYTFAIGTPDSSKACNIESNNMAPTGDYPDCVSAAKIFDAVGNVWEWTVDDVIEGDYNNRTLPNEGFVTQVDNDGVATVTDAAPSEEFNADYFWNQRNGAYGMLRGGFFGSGEDAGVYAVHTKTVPTAATVAIGFRCVR
tara:strand:- start:659 stop:1465 length:807 start_codon:yes stop_codon:yes gene_type:complete